MVQLQQCSLCSCSSASVLLLSLASNGGKKIPQNDPSTELQQFLWCTGSAPTNKQPALVKLFRLSTQASAYFSAPLLLLPCALFFFFLRTGWSFPSCSGVCRQLPLWLGSFKGANHSISLAVYTVCNKGGGGGSYCPVDAYRWSPGSTYSTLDSPLLWPQYSPYQWELNVDEPWQKTKCTFWSEVVGN